MNLELSEGKRQVIRFNKRKFLNHKVTFRKLPEKHVPLSKNKKLIVQWGGFLLPLLSAVLLTIASLIISCKEKNV